MAVDAAQIAYTKQYVASAERRESTLMQCVTREFIPKGNTATFLVAGSGNRSAVTRGTNGLISASAGSQSQPTATLVEWYDKETKTDFNVFASQGNQREISMQNVAAVINRKCDDTIIDTLDTTTTNVNTSGTATTADVQLCMHAVAALHNNDFQNDGRIYAAVTPAFWAYMMQASEFSSKDFVSDEKFTRGSQQMLNWLGVKWIMHTGLPGKGTAAEECFIWHESAIGLAVDTRGIQITGGHNEEHDYYWHMAKVFLGAAKLQNSGIVRIYHNGSAFATV